MKALALLSGGLDSMLAIKLIQDQGIEVEALNFSSPFCLCGKGGCGSVKAAQQLNVPLKVISMGDEYVKMIRHPRHGYGRNMNPCLDCRIFILKKAKKYSKQAGASFIFTGEVLDERPMSQHRRALDILEKETGLRGKIVRPLSAKLLPETEAEKRGWVDRNRLESIRGRSRRKQFALAKSYELNDFPCPSGGCLLTYREFADKVRDLLAHTRSVKSRDIALLKIGRHFRNGRNKMIVGRNAEENQKLLALKKPSDLFFEVPDCGSPITLLQGPKTKTAIVNAATLTARYSDSKNEHVLVNYGKQVLDDSITVTAMRDSEIEKLRIHHAKAVLGLREHAIEEAP